MPFTVSIPTLKVAGCQEVDVTSNLAGAWATLQFKWMQLRYPVVVLALEKLVLATTFSTAATVQAWGLTAAVGAAVAPFYLTPLLCIMFHMLACPLATSFHVRGAKGSAIGKRLHVLHNLPLNLSSVTKPIARTLTCFVI